MDASATWRSVPLTRRRLGDRLRVEPLDDRTVPTTLLFTTAGDVTGNGTPTLNSWTAGTALQLGGSTLALEPGTTTGTFSALFNINQFTDSDVDLDGLHLVRQTVTIGTGANAFTVQPGDLILSIDHDGKMLASLNQLTVDRGDVFIFRPQAPGDYSAGTFFPLLDNFDAVHGGGDTWAIALVETDTLVGDVTLPAGSFLFSRDGSNADNDIHLFVPTGVGIGTTAGTVSVLIEGDDLGIGPKLVGIDLVEAPTVVGGRVLPAGTLLLGVDGDATIGNTPVTRFDVFALKVSQTTLGSGTTVGSATLLFDGSDIGLDGGSEALRDFSLASVNSRPRAADDSYTVAEDTTLTGASVLPNDTDPDGDPLTAELVTSPANGTLTLNPDGSFVYVPAPNFNGTDSFTYRATDGTGFSAPATVTITVTPVNDPPAAGADAYVTDQNTGINVPTAGVLANDVDVDGDPLAVVIDAGPSGGTATLNPDGSFIYTPRPAFRGTDTFRYRVTDPDGASAIATVTIKVLPPSGAPVALDDAYTVAEDTVLTVPAAGVLGNDTPPGNLPVVARLVDGPDHGTLAFLPDGSFVYVPDPNYFGPDAFTYKAVDINGKASGAAHVRMTVTPEPDPPVAVPDQFATDAGVPVTSNVLANDTDPDGDPLTAVLVRGPATGTVTLNPHGSFTYTPSAGFTGADTFTYRANDGTADSGVTTVTITVRPPALPEPIPPAPPPDVVPPPTVDPAPDPGPGEPPPGDPPTPGAQAPAPVTVPVSVPVFGVPVGAVSLGPTAYISGPGGPAFVPLHPPLAATIPDPPALPPLPAVPTPPVAGPVEVPVRPILIPPPEISAVGTAPRTLPPAAEAALDAELSELGAQLQTGKVGRVVTDVTIATGVVATAGYVFLTPKLAFWLLSALLARRTVWKPFDPLEVVCAWEEEQKTKKPADRDDESLESLVGTGPEAKTT